MNTEEKPKHIWKISTNFLIWLVASLAILLAVLIIGLCHDKPPKDAADFLVIWVAGFGGGLIALLLWRFMRWLCCWRNAKRFAVGCSCLALLFVLARVEENVRGWYQWKQFKAEWETRGERFDFKDFVPPPVPDEQNFAMTPIVVSCYAHILDKNGHRIEPAKTNIVNRLKMSTYCENDYDDYFDAYHGINTNLNRGSWQKSQLSDLGAWQEYYRHAQTNSSEPTNEFPVAPQPQTPAADVLLALSKYDGALKELAEASRLPASRFPLNYESKNPVAIMLPHLVALKRCAQTLQLRALAELEAGLSAKACADTVLIFRLAEKVRSEPILFTHLVRIAMTQIAAQVIYEGLAAHRWSESELVELSAEIGRQNVAADCKFAMRGELGWQGAFIDFLRKEPELFFDMKKSEDLEVPLELRLIFYLIPPGWVYQNQVNCARMMTKNIIPIANETNRTFSVNVYKRAEHGFDNFTPLSIFHISSKMLTPSLRATTKRFALCQSALNLADAAIALERYRLAHGDYPKSLDTLAPQFTAQLPHDAIGGQPLKYRREANGQFILYSVGWNETDDGGAVVFREHSPDTIDVNQGDWVWRYPGNIN